MRRYVGIGLPPGAVAFTGSRFEHLAGGGDRPEIADRITAEDLVAVQRIFTKLRTDDMPPRWSRRIAAYRSTIDCDFPTGPPAAAAHPHRPTASPWVTSEQGPGTDHGDRSRRVTEAFSAM
ncbi:DUF6308 family protein [Streptomyces sp. NPDC019990]|uniref:DUF6308 family protein n=1 Tax=Streptomyces sp. NPDC019990 TaxID=3154693 RepID=UPI0033C54C18